MQFRPLPMMFRIATIACCVVAICQSAVWGQSTPAVPEDHSATQKVSLISSSSGSVGGPFNGLNINNFLGANRFYNAGFTGSTARVGNIEAGHVFGGHSTLGHVTTFVTGTGAVGSVDEHATSVTHMMSGRLAANTFPTNYFGYGIAYGATTWSGAIATGFGGGGSFATTNSSTASVYSTMMITGVGGQTVDVFNSSWGISGSPTGNNVDTVGIDGMINQSRKIGVFAAGNDGPGANTVSSPGVGFNVITVGALGADTGANPYNTVSSFSSRGPSPFYHAGTGQTINGVRATVDIMAPGQNLTTASSAGPNSYIGGNLGTSFAAPIVAGGAGLVVDVGRQLYGTADAIDGRVVKSVLLNSATKTTGWSNGQALVGGVITTTQSLDYVRGAGRMNLDRAFDQYVNTANGGMAGTFDVAGTGSGDLGNVSNVGWDFGQVSIGGANQYFMELQVAAGSTLNATLSWFTDTNPGNLGNFSGVAYRRYDDLNLRVFQFDNLTNRNIIGSIAQSISLYNSVEHLSFTVANQGFYGIEVIHNGVHWNFGGGNAGQFYGLAWHSVGMIPEPGSLMVLTITLSIVTTLRRRRK